MTLRNDTTARPAPPAVDPRTWRKAAIRIMPIVALAYLMSYIDRVNLGYIAGPIGQSLSMTTAQVGFASSIFFVGYILLEVPSNMALHRFGARKWIARILISWGILTGITGAVTTVQEFYLLRLLLGFAEAGLAAGILLYLTYWFPRKHRGWASSLFMLTIPLAGIIGAPMAAALLAWGQEAFGIAGWRDLFILEGVLTVIAGAVVLLFLTDRPRDAKWLTPDEREQIQGVLDFERERQLADGALTSLRQSLTSGRVWALGIAFFAIVFGLYPLAFFLPTMISGLTGFLGASSADAALLSAIPSVAAIIVMIIWARMAQNMNAVAATVAPMALGAIGLLLATFTHQGVIFIVAACLGTAGIYTAMPQFWRLPAQTLTGAAAAGGIAVINTVSNLSGVFGPSITGAIQTATGSFTDALLGIALIMIAGIAIVLTVGRKVDRVGTTAPLGTDALV